MPRATITAEGFSELTAHDSSAAWIWFLNIGLHPRESGVSMPPGTQGDKLWICNNNVDTKAPITIYTGEPGEVISYITYAAYPFSFVPPSADASKSPEAIVSFDNVDRLFVDTIRRAEYPMQVEVGLGATYYNGSTGETYCDGFELWVNKLELFNVKWNVQEITGTLVRDNAFGKAYPSNHPIYNQINFPGLYGTGDVVTVQET